MVAIDRRSRSVEPAVEIRRREPDWSKLLAEVPNDHPHLPIARLVAHNILRRASVNELSNAQSYTNVVKFSAVWAAEQDKGYPMGFRRSERIRTAKELKESETKESSLAVRAAAVETTVGLGYVLSEEGGIVRPQVQIIDTEMTELPAELSSEQLQVLAEKEERARKIVRDMDHASNRNIRLSHFSTLLGYKSQDVPPAGYTYSIDHRTGGEKVVYEPTEGNATEDVNIERITLTSRPSRFGDVIDQTMTIEAADHYDTLGRKATIELSGRFGYFSDPDRPFYNLEYKGKWENERRMDTFWSIPGGDGTRFRERPVYTRVLNLLDSLLGGKELVTTPN